MKAKRYGVGNLELRMFRWSRSSMTLLLEFQRRNRLRKLEQADRTRLQSSGAWVRIELGLVYLDLSTTRSSPSTFILSFDFP